MLNTFCSAFHSSLPQKLYPNSNSIEEKICILPFSTKLRYHLNNITRDLIYGWEEKEILKPTLNNNNMCVRCYSVDVNRLI